MFTGIIEAVGTVDSVKVEGQNRRVVMRAPFTEELQVDQSVSHNGICLTVERINAVEQTYEVVAVEETLRKTQLGEWQSGHTINLERCLKVGGRLDGHWVQGHVDMVARVSRIGKLDGSLVFRFEHPKGEYRTVEKGSVAVNGVSLTCFDTSESGFSVTIIPYTYAHTNFGQLKEGDLVNLEFDILGKYIAQHLKAYGRAIPDSPAGSI